jgi:hypothetical protein
MMGETEKESDQTDENDEMFCWICGRSASDVRSALDRPTAEELEVVRLIEMVESSKKEFVSSSADWEDSIPRQHDGVMLDTLFKSPEEFNSIDVLDELAKSKKFLLDAIISAFECIRSGKEVNLGMVQFKASDDRHRSLLEKGSIEFHRVTGKILNDPMLSKETSLRDGVKVLREAGLLYFEIQRGILGFRMEDAIRNRPDPTVEQVLVSGLPWEISLCTICRHLVGNS